MEPSAIASAVPVSPCEKFGIAGARTVVVAAPASEVAERPAAFSVDSTVVAAAAAAVDVIVDTGLVAATAATSVTVAFPGRGSMLAVDCVVDVVVVVAAATSALLATE